MHWHWTLGCDASLREVTIPSSVTFPACGSSIPSTPYDAKGLFTHALRCDDPVLFLEPRELLSIKGPVPAGVYEIEFGRARVLREGKHVTVVGIGVMAHRALAAADRLAEEGVSVEVIDPRTVSPLDTAAILASVRKTGRLLVVDEAFAPCSVASEIAAVVADAGFNDLDAPIRATQRRLRSDTLQSHARGCGSGKRRCDRGSCPRSDE